MSKITFIYKETKIVIPYTGNETMNSVINKFYVKSEIPVNSVNFLCQGSVVNSGTFASNIPLNKNEKQILVIDKDNNINQDKIIKSDEIICNICKESAKMDIIDYKIDVSGCINKHSANKMLLKEFENSQNINISKIICDICNSANKGDSYNNQFYRCLSCKCNICIICKQKHPFVHNIINYDQKNYICIEHGEFYHSYCYNCEQNMCISCENAHRSHAMESYGVMIKDKNILFQESENLKKKIKKFNEVIEVIIANLKKVSENLILYYKIHKRVISNINNKLRNYQTLSNINNFNINNVTNDLDKIINDDNIFDQVNNILIMHHKMENISIPSNINKQESSEKNQNNNAISKKEQKKMNEVEAINLIKNMLIETVEKTPLITDLIDTNLIVDDYKKDSPFLKPLAQLINTYKKFRRIRKDGNSFYTCFIYRLFEYICINQNKSLFDKICKIVNDSSNLIINSGYDWETLKEFYSVFIEMFKTCFSKGVLSQDEAKKFLDDMFKNNNVYNYLNYFIRNSIAAFVKDNQLFYENFISQDFTDWLNNITQAGNEVSQIEIIACVNYFDIGVKIVNLYETKIDVDRYPEETKDEEIFIYVLLRGNHYDLLYLD